MEEKNDPFLKAGCEKIFVGVHGTEYKIGNYIVYTIPNKELNIVVSDDMYEKLKNNYDFQLYHSTAMRTYPKRLNRGQRKIHYGYKATFDSEGDLIKFLLAVKNIKK